MKRETIAYFGNEKTYGFDCQPLRPEHMVTAIMNRGDDIKMTVSDMHLISLGDWKYPISYIPH